MTSAWTYGAAPIVSGLASESVTLLEGATFAISTPGGDIEPGGAQGLFCHDTRFVSSWRLTVADAPVEHLVVIPKEPFAASFLGRGRPAAGQADSTILVRRDRYVGNGMREDLVIRNLGSEAAACSLSLEVDADFAHLFEVKEGRVRVRGQRTIAAHGSSLIFDYSDRESTRRLEVHCPPEAKISANLILLEVVVQPRDEWSGSFELELAADGERINLRYHKGQPVEHSTPVTRLRAWQQRTPKAISGRPGLNVALAQSIEDLGALRIFDPANPARPVIAAGAPWFMTLFGRDSLIASLMTLAVDPTLAVGTLQTLARFQGRRVDPLSEEEPGRILHEVRRGLQVGPELPLGTPYYGSIDATPLFVVLVGELYRWGASPDVVEELLPHVDRALAWIDDYGDRDKDGFVEYQRATARGLRNQGWKDSFDGVNFANGRLAEPPIALAEVQGYVYAAFRARALLARGTGDEATAERYEARASALRASFNDAFWIADGEYFALGLDADKRPIDSITSNMGHLLWTEVVDEAKARRVAEHLVSPGLFSGWGIRTLGASMTAYNPVSYHNGSVWPHDTAICAAGLARYGFLEEAHAVTRALLDAAETVGGRLPELMCGFDREEYPLPVRYPTSCSPQAWASAAPFLLVRSVLLRLDACVPDRTVWLAPSLGDGFGPLHLENVPLAGHRLTIDVDGTDVHVDGLPKDLRLVLEPRPLDLPGPGAGSRRHAR
ncbi:MAG TPA: glycogen debranching N-terminal domain-containing protein [Acidimicrobiales bacterium]|nr:glycogen debranching N-terminal domain-containing protein [Acidimicrobiales bacterium]